MSLEVTALGTGAAFPSPRRGTSAVALRLPDGSVWLFDCGEGTQTQLMRSPLKPGRVTKIFITHLHGDHVFGLPGLMCSLSMLAFGTADAAAPPDEEAPAEGPRVTAGPPQLEVFGPVGLRRLLRVALQLSRSQLGFRFAVHELRPSAQQWSAADSGDWRPPEERGPRTPRRSPAERSRRAPPRRRGSSCWRGAPVPPPCEPSRCATACRASATPSGSPPGPGDSTWRCAARAPVRPPEGGRGCDAAEREGAAAGRGGGPPRARPLGRRVRRLLGAAGPRRSEAVPGRRPAGARGDAGGRAAGEGPPSRPLHPVGRRRHGAGVRRPPPAAHAPQPALPARRA
ncbi:ribonuclease Z-like isoform X2 [Lethenteron reissneri]|uniref:ribonuclease Z-like isoform X2 n=1 Tax=Lethenteron reissneri TaxID=7753 RepID=UPI002AB68CA4|nr:ribonuclease Z-like isoform X2 [Lethenteron reissneri]